MANTTIKDRRGLLHLMTDMGDGTSEQRVLNVNADGTVVGAPLVTSDLTPVVINIAAAATTAIVSATASQTTRVYRMRLNVAGAQQITVQSNSTTLEVLNFTAAGFFVWDYSSRPYYKTAVNQALNFVTTTTAQVNGVVEYIKSV